MARRTMMTVNGQRIREADHAVRDRLALALDFDDLETARATAARLAPWFGVVKVGLQLFIAEGRGAVEALAADGFAVFLDLKLHDIPRTVSRAAQQAGRTGAAFLTVHAAGGEAMVAAAVESFGRPEVLGQAGSGGGRRPTGGVLAVTVLTSERDAPAGVVAARTRLAARLGCAGVVCAATDLPVVREAAPNLLSVVPGVRLAGAAADDQARAATPAEAAAAGAGLLVVGRTVTAAADQESATRAIVEQIADV
jgi:orotidine-5'-phosphate decarboxylase